MLFKNLNTSVIYDYLINNGITKQQLCKKCDIGLSTLNRMLGFRGGATLRTILKIKENTTIDVNKLLNFNKDWIN